MRRAANKRRRPKTARESTVSGRRTTVPPKRGALRSDPRTSRPVKAGQYVYGVIRATDALRIGPVGVGVGARPTDVRTVQHRQLAAIVSDAAAGALDPTRDNILGHERVNEEVLRRHTVLPMSFGTVFRSEEDVTAMLRDAYDTLRTTLTKMDGKVEYGVKVLWDRDLQIRELERDDADLRRLKETIARTQGANYFARVQYGRLVERALEAHAERFSEQVTTALGELSTATHVMRPIGDRVILNAAFLVKRDEAAAFDGRLTELGATLGTLSLRCSGPWPPYHFVNIRLRVRDGRK